MTKRTRAAAAVATAVASTSGADAPSATTRVTAGVKREAKREVKSEARPAAKRARVTGGEDGDPGCPEGMKWTPTTYKRALLQQFSTLSKDPPVCPPRTITVVVERMPPPTRNKDGTFVFADAPTFCPNRSPAEILKAGAFGGGYFRDIFSTVTQQKYKGKDVIKQFPPEWFKGLSVNELHSPTYRASVNHYKAKCGGDLNMWESSGWIADSDPYGWFEWYCHFFNGRRCSDDERQLSRAGKCFGETGRWRTNLLNKVIRAGAAVDDARISPVIRQTLLHWGYIPTAKHLEIQRKRLAKKEKK